MKDFIIKKLNNVFFVLVQYDIINFYNSHNRNLLNTYIVRVGQGELMQL